MRPLGYRQEGVLEALATFGRWVPNGHCGWVWNSVGGTQKILDSLVKRGLVEVVPGTHWPEYRLSKAGRDYCRERLG